MTLIDIWRLIQAMFGIPSSFIRQNRVTMILVKRIALILIALVCCLLIVLAGKWFLRSNETSLDGFELASTKAVLGITLLPLSTSQGLDEFDEVTFDANEFDCVLVEQGVSGP